MNDVFFLSYDEPHADRHWEILKASIPFARRVHGISGIQAAHKHCAGISRTPFFFVVDADNEVIDFSPFEYEVNTWDRDYVHLWFARNPVNGLEYGWGGLKLFPRSVFARTEPRLDMTTSLPLKVFKEVKSITHFNTSPFDTWRSAFREAVKLVQNPTEEQQEWLRVWCTKASGPYADMCLLGAQEGRQYGNDHHEEELMVINDYNWLKEQFAG